MYVAYSGGDCRAPPPPEQNISLFTQIQIIYLVVQRANIVFAALVNIVLNRSTDMTKRGAEEVDCRTGIPGRIIERINRAFPNSLILLLLTAWHWRLALDIILSSIDRPPVKTPQCSRRRLKVTVKPRGCEVGWRLNSQGGRPRHRTLGHTSNGCYDYFGCFVSVVWSQPPTIRPASSCAQTYG